MLRITRFYSFLSAEIGISALGIIILIALAFIVITSLVGKVLKFIIAGVALVIVLYWLLSYF